MEKKSESLSPWGMKRAESVKIRPLTKRFETEIRLPGSKSYTNRAILLAAVSDGTSRLFSPLFSDDTFWCAEALSKLGVNIRADRNEGVISVDGVNKLKVIDELDLPYLGSAGTIARFLPGIVAARGEGEITLTSSEQLAGRPVYELINSLRDLGAEIRLPENVSFPMTIKGGSLAGGKTTVSGKTSSQFISGLLLSAPLAKEPVCIKISDRIVQADYVRITLELMEKFGVNVDHDRELKEFYTQPQNYKAQDILLEADASTATYFFALAAATKSKITITNLNPDTLQPDLGFVNHLENLGCKVEKDGEKISVTGPEQLKGGKTFDFNACSDSTPALVAIAPFADAPVKVKGVEHIRHHECDRLSVMRENLEKARVRVVEHRDGLEITPTPGAPQTAVINPYDDHRMAMAFSVVSAAGRGGTILDPACVSKTCPSFFELLGHVGIECEIVNATVKK